MNAIILFSHGSLLCGAGETLKVHARKLQERGLAERVEVGFLNYSDPDFLVTVKDLSEAGVTQILVTPYFLVPGVFVKVNLPERIAEAKAQFPHIEFTVTEALGFDPRLADAVLESAWKATPSETWRNTLAEATHFCRPAPVCPLYDTPLCPKRAGNGKLGEVIVPETQAERTSFKESALLVMIHGSPRPIANEKMYEVVQIVRGFNLFATVEVGFMECNAPSIPEAIDLCVSHGVKEVVAVPYFLHTGNHVADDLPTLLEEAQEKYPNVRFLLGDYLGKSDALTEILESRILQSINAL